MKNIAGSKTLDQDITSLSAARIAREVAERKVSAREVVEAALARVDAVNPTLNAICTLNDAALDEADAVDRRLAGGGAPRPLEGVPVVVKDNIFTRGIRTTFGSKILEHDVPEEDSICVERLRAAGAIVLGKTNTPEFAHDVNTTNAVFGTTRNPWNVNHTAGGIERGHRLGGRGAIGARGARHRSRRFDPHPVVLQRPRRDPRGSGTGGVLSHRVRLGHPGRARPGSDGPDGRGRRPAAGRALRAGRSRSDVAPRPGARLRGRRAGGRRTPRTLPARGSRSASTLGGSSRSSPRPRRSCGARRATSRPSAAR